MSNVRPQKLIMRALAAILATTILSIVGLPVEVLAHPTSNSVVVSPLPPEMVFPLVGEQCSCATFRKGTALVDDAVLFSFRPDSAHARLANRDYELTNRSRKLVGKRWINTFIGAGVGVTLEMTETSYEEVCSTYSDPPPHGSCFVGTIRARVGQKSTSFPVVQLCGC